MTTETATALSDLRPAYVYTTGMGMTWWCRVCAEHGAYFQDVAQATEDAREHGHSCLVLHVRGPVKPLHQLGRAPRRVQLRRSPGWRMPKSAVKVSRGTRWGNPWVVGAHMPTVLPGGTIDLERRLITRQLAVASYRHRTEWLMRFDAFAAELRRELAGRDLACWCKLDDECHADVLLALAET